MGPSKFITERDIHCDNPLVSAWKLVLASERSHVACQDTSRDRIPTSLPTDILSVLTYYRYWHTIGTDIPSVLTYYWWQLSCAVYFAEKNLQLCKMVGVRDFGIRRGIHLAVFRRGKTKITNPHSNQIFLQSEKSKCTHEVSSHSNENYV